MLTTGFCAAACNSETWKFLLRELHLLVKTGGILAELSAQSLITVAEKIPDTEAWKFVLLDVYPDVPPEIRLAILRLLVTRLPLDAEFSQLLDDFANFHFSAHCLELAVEARLATFSAEPALVWTKRKLQNAPPPRPSTPPPPPPATDRMAQRIAGMISSASPGSELVNLSRLLSREFFASSSPAAAQLGAALLPEVARRLRGAKGDDQEELSRLVSAIAAVVARSVR